MRVPAMRLYVIRRANLVLAGNHDLSVARRH
jgi:hypothetical protein